MTWDSVSGRLSQGPREELVTSSRYAEALGRTELLVPYPGVTALILDLGHASPGDDGEEEVKKGQAEGRELRHVAYRLPLCNKPQGAAAGPSQVQVLAEETCPQGCREETERRGRERGGLAGRGQSSALHPTAPSFLVVSISIWGANLARPCCLWAMRPHAPGGV